MHLELVELSCTQNERNGLRCQKQRIACHRWVCWWAWSPILESNCHMAKRWSCCEVEPLPNCSFMFQSFDSQIFNWVTASWHRVLHAERSRVSSPRADGSMPHCFKLTFRVSLYRNTGPHCRHFPAASCPRNTCFGIRLSGMRIMWPTQRSCTLKLIGKGFYRKWVKSSFEQFITTQTRVGSTNGWIIWQNAENLNFYFSTISGNLRNLWRHHMAKFRLRWP